MNKRVVVPKGTESVEEDRPKVITKFVPVPVPVAVPVAAAEQEDFEEDFEAMGDEEESAPAVKSAAPAKAFDADSKASEASAEEKAVAPVGKFSKKSKIVHRHGKGSKLTNTDHNVKFVIKTGGQKRKHPIAPNPLNPANFPLTHQSGQHPVGTAGYVAPPVKAAAKPAAPVKAAPAKAAPAKKAAAKKAKKPAVEDSADHYK